MKFDSFIQKNQFLFLVLIVVFIGALWRIIDINLFKAFSGNEVDLLKLAEQTVANHWHLNINDLPQAAYIYYLALVGTLTKFSPIGFRIIQGGVGIMASIFFYLFVKSWFNKQVSLISTLFFSTNAFLLILSRALNPALLIILLQLIILYVVTLAFREKNIFLFIISGLLAGAGFYLSPFFVLSGFFIVLAGVVVVLRNKKIFTAYRYELIALLVSILAASGYYLYKLPGIWHGLTSFFNPGTIAGFYLNLGANTLAIFSGTQAGTIFNVGLEPLVDPFVAVTFFCGIVFALFHANKRKYLFLLLWLLASVVVISLANIQAITNLALLMPAIFIFSASILDYILTNWTRTFPYNRMAKVLMTMVFSLFIFLSIYYNYQKFFYGWQQNDTVKNNFTEVLSDQKAN